MDGTVNNGYDHDELNNWLNKENPYDNIDTNTLPEWWVDSVDEFQYFDLQPYKPPLFEDDRIVPLVVGQLEEVYDIKIKIMGVNVSHGDNWEVYVDGNAVTTIDRYRTTEGFTRYRISSERFRGAVERYVE